MARGHTRRFFLEAFHLERISKENVERVKTLFGAQYQFFTPVQFNGTVNVNGEIRNVS